MYAPEKNLHDIQDEMGRDKPPLIKKASKGLASKVAATGMKAFTKPLKIVLQVDSRPSNGYIKEELADEVPKKGRDAGVPEMDNPTFEVDNGDEVDT